MSPTSPNRRRCIIYQAGDSYPLDRHVEVALMERLSPHAARFIRHVETLAGADRVASLAERRRLLAETVREAGQTVESMIIIGRSSGARTATLLAADGALAGINCCVIALGYPFQHPERAFELDRIAHLAAITTRTLIIQGKFDRYGGPAIAMRHRRPPVIEVATVDANHELYLGAGQWDEVAAMILQFAG